MPSVIVTGCSRATGFGQHVARKLAQAGFDVFATLRDVERGAELEAWARKKALRLTTLEHDVTRPEQNQRVVDQVLEATGRIDALVNNVGMSSFGALETLNDAHIRRVMETNFFSAVDLTRAALPAMRRQRRGRILFVTSVAGFTGLPGEALYCASKFALEGLAESLAMETARFGITVSTIRPAFFRTGMSMDNTDTTDFYRTGTAWDEFNNRVIRSTSEGEAGGEDPARVAETVLAALTTEPGRLRWYPGEAASAIFNARKTMDDERWRHYAMAELGMADWLKPHTDDVMNAAEGNAA